jgi:hypothetical protein
MALVRDAGKRTSRLGEEGFHPLWRHLHAMRQPLIRARPHKGDLGISSSPGRDRQIDAERVAHRCCKGSTSAPAGHDRGEAGAPYLAHDNAGRAIRIAVAPWRGDAVQSRDRRGGKKSVSHAAALPQGHRKQDHTPQLACRRSARDRKHARFPRAARVLATAGRARSSGRATARTRRT